MADEQMSGTTAPAVGATFGPFFEVAEDGAGHRSVAELVRDPRALSDLVDETRHTLAHRDGVTLDQVELRVAASVWFGGVAARLVSPLLGAQVLGGCGPYPVLTTAAVTLPDRPGPLGISVSSVSTVSTADSLAEAVLEPVVRPLVDALSAELRVSSQVLWGDVASALAGAATVIRAVQPSAGAIAWRLADEALLAPPLDGSGTSTPAGFRRRSCCLVYRLPTGELCADCVLHAAPRLRTGVSGTASPGRCTPTADRRG